MDLILEIRRVYEGGGQEDVAEAPRRAGRSQRGLSGLPSEGARRAPGPGPRVKWLYICSFVSSKSVSLSIKKEDTLRIIK